MLLANLPPHSDPSMISLRGSVLPLNPDEAL